MKTKLRPFAMTMLGMGVLLLAAPSVSRAQGIHWGPIFSDSAPMAVRSGAPGYLGVDIADLDADRAQSLHLKEARGALITLIDHDAPAGKAGLRINDVVLSVDGMNLTGSEQLRRILRDSSVGRKLSLVVSRDGTLLNFTLQLADRKAIESEAFNSIGTGPAAAPMPSSGSFSMLPSGTRNDADSRDNGILMPSRGNKLNVGAQVEPLTQQMADYLGLISGGIIVKQVARKSEAELAGLREQDVVLKVGAEPVKTMADWERSLLGNQGKAVTVTILRDKKQQTITLQVASRRG